ncbi:unnamed protein product [Symbiodinium sp. CCMP2592]|nr:unnamed protein product [Symbiodinium sp. CCMP2592]
MVADAMQILQEEVKLSSVKKRMARMFAPRVDGSYLVPKELVDQYKDLSQRPALEAEFLKSGLDKDLFVRRSVKKIKRRESESEVWVSGQFVSDLDMDELGLTEKRKKAVHDECAKMRGWIRRDRYEPDVKLYWLEKSVEAKVLKRKREIYEEVDSDAEFEESDNEKDLDVFSHSWGLGDGGDDKNVAGADRESDVKQRIKSISFPDMDADGLPSSYIVKVVQCLGKWNAKIQGVKDQLEQFKKSEKTDKILTKASTILKGLDETSEKIQHKQSESVLQDVGFSLEQQGEIKKLFDVAKKQCVEALSFSTGCGPMIVYLRSQKKKDDAGHSYLSRFLIAAYPSKQWPPELLADIIKALSTQLREIFETGLLVQGRRFYIGIMGMKGDFEFHCTSLRDAGLKRSYEHVGRAKDLPVCIECEAGFQESPFEDSNPNALWTRTIGKSAPWESAPSFVQMPFDNWSSFPSGVLQFFRRDPFHVFRLGVARNFLASAILLLCNFGAFDLLGESKSVENRLARAWKQFQLFLETTSLHVGGLRSFSKKKMHFASGGSFPWLGCKGSDTIVLFKWLRVLLVQLRVRGTSPVTGHDFTTCRACYWMELALTGGLHFSQGIHGHSLWMVQSCTDSLRQALRDFLRGYSQLAQFCLLRKIPLFGLTPKYHALAHFKHDLEKALQGNLAATLNPATWDCSMSEDFIGRVSRQSRRIGYKRNLFEKHVLQHYLLKFGFVLGRWKQEIPQPSGARTGRKQRARGKR